MSITSIEGFKSSALFMSDQLMIVLTTLPSEWEEFRVGSFAQLLLESGAACVEYSPVRSVYIWEGKVTSSKEWKLEIKSSLSSKTRLLDALNFHHPYDVPQIVYLSAETSELYAAWAAQDLPKNAGA